MRTFHPKMSPVDDDGCCVGRRVGGLVGPLPPVGLLVGGLVTGFADGDELGLDSDDSSTRRLELGVLDGETLGLFVGDVDGLDDRWTEGDVVRSSCLELGDDDAVGALVGGLVGLWRLGALVGGLVGLCPPVGGLVGGLVELDVELDAELDAELDSELDAELDVVFVSNQ